jgi:hypothetical protein
MRNQAVTGAVDISAMSQAGYTYLDSGIARHEGGKSHEWI